MTPPHVTGGPFRIGIHAVVDNQVGARDQSEDVAIGCAGDVLGIGEIAHRAPGELEAVTGRAIGVIQRCGAQRDFWRRVERIAGGEIVVRDVRAKYFGPHRKERRNHELPEDCLERCAPAEMPRPQAKSVFRLEQGPEERQPAHVIEVRVRQVQVRIERRIARQMIAQIADSRARVEEQQAFSAADLQRGGVSAIAQRVRPRARDASAHAPETNGEALAGHRPTISDCRKADRER